MIYIIYKPGIIVFIYPGYKLHGTGNILMIKGILHTLRAEYSHYFYLCLGYSIVFCSLWFKASKCWNNGKENSIPTTEMVENEIQRIDMNPSTSMVAHFNMRTYGVNIDFWNNLVTSAELSNAFFFWKDLFYLIRAQLF